MEKVSKLGIKGEEMAAMRKWEGVRDGGMYLANLGR